MRRLVINDIGPVLEIEAINRIASYVGLAPNFATYQELYAATRMAITTFGPLTDEQYHHMVGTSCWQRPDGRCHPREEARRSHDHPRGGGSRRRGRTVDRGRPGRCPGPMRPPRTSRKVLHRGRGVATAKMRGFGPDRLLLPALDWRATCCRATTRALPESLPEASRSSSRMIAEGDSVARNAFRVGLRQDTPLPTVASTQELDPSDILEVRDMAEAIARAEKIVAAPRSSRTRGPDIFEALGRPTDDTAGPATAAPPRQTPVPPPPAPSVPRFIAMPAAPMAPAPAPPSRHAIPTGPTGAEDDAYFHPAGRMRAFADVTLDGYRPEPTLLLRAASRRKRYSWVLLAAVLPLVALAGFAISETASAAGEATVVTKRTPAVAVNGKTSRKLWTCCSIGVTIRLVTAYDTSHNTIAWWTK